MKNINFVFYWVIMQIEISEVRVVDEELVEAMERLMPQLSPWLVNTPVERLGAIVASSTAALLVARCGDSGEVVGTLTLAWYAAPSAVKGWIEDVVVDGRMRGRGVGRMLVQEALRRAKAAGVESIHLTSRPARVAARALYDKMGFKEVGTTLFAIKNNEI